MTETETWIGTETDYMSHLRFWAGATLSSPEPRWRGPGVYRFGGYMSDENRPTATLEKEARR